MQCCLAVYVQCKDSISSKWRMIIAVNFPIQAIGKTKPGKIKASMEFEPMTSPIPVRCSIATNWAMKPHIGSEENLLRWSLFTLICNRSSNIWIISYNYILHITAFHVNASELTCFKAVSQTLKCKATPLQSTPSNLPKTLVKYRCTLGLSGLYMARVR